MDKKIFFNASLPRAGSTLLQNIIGQNPDFHVTPTSGMAEIIAHTHNAFSQNMTFKREKDYNLPKEAFYNFCRGGINSFYKTLTNKPYILDKNREWLSEYYFLKKLYPNLKIIFIVRDIRDIISSLEKIYRDDINLPFNLRMAHSEGENFNPNLLRDRLNSYFSKPPLFPFINILQEFIITNNLQHIHFVKFEEFCLNPTSVINSIYNFLDLPYYNHTFDNINQITWENDSLIGLGTHIISPKLSLPPSDYKKVLGEEISRQIYHKYEWFFKFFKYNL